MLLFKQKINNNLASSNDQPTQAKVEPVKDQNDYSFPTISNEKKTSFTLSGTAEISGNTLSAGNTANNGMALRVESAN